MRLSKKQRQQLKAKFDGCCAYCGEPLGERWHADHLESVIRLTEYVSGRGYVATGEKLRPDNDRVGNLMPACIPCNISKGPHSLEDWRRLLESMCGVMARDIPTYRNARRFGLISETRTPIVFHFEKQSR